MPPTAVGNMKHESHDLTIRRRMLVPSAEDTAEQDESHASIFCGPFRIVVHDDRPPTRRPPSTRLG
jgi:hypothetical protein